MTQELRRQQRQEKNRNVGNKSGDEIQGISYIQREKMLNVLLNYYNLNILLFTGLTEKSLAEFTHLSPFWDDHVPSDEETASLCSFDTVSTGQVSCALIRHGMARMHQRNITIEMIQRTKKRGQLLLQFLADAENEEMMAMEPKTAILDRK